MNKNIFSIKNLTLNYESKKIFQNMNLDIPANKVTAIVGPSGCGKSSFLICLNRMIELEKNANVSGQIDFLQIPIHEYDVQVLRKRVAMVYQKPTPFPFSIEKNFKIPLLEYNVKNWKDKMITALQRVGLYEEIENRLHHPATLLSGGQQQRLCIARAISLDPEVILMDEPCSALDPLSSKTIENLISDLSQKYTVVIVTHNLAQAKRISQQMAFFWWCKGAGCLMEKGETQNLFHKPKYDETKKYIQSEML